MTALKFVISVFCAMIILPAMSYASRHANHLPAPMEWILDSEDTLEHPYFAAVHNTSIELTPAAIALIDEPFLTETVGEQRRPGILKPLLLGLYALSDVFRPESQRVFVLSRQETDQLEDHLFAQMLDYYQTTSENLEHDGALLTKICQKLVDDILRGVGYTDADIIKLRELVGTAQPLPATYDELHELTEPPSRFREFIDSIAKHF